MRSRFLIHRGVCRGLCWALLALCSLLAVGPVFASSQPLRVGVLAALDADTERQRWAPLADHLARHSGHPVTLAVVTADQMEQALRRGQLDAALLHPSLFVGFQAQRLLGAPLATLVSTQGGQNSAALGGVVFAREGAQAPTTWADLAGRRIATAGIHWFAAHQVPLHEMHLLGLPPPTEGQWLHLNGSQEEVVRAVADGRADVGFVRSGLLERLDRTGAYPMSQWRVVQSQSLPHFPFVSSTRLYPEWPAAARPGLPESTQSDLARAWHATPRGLVEGVAGFTVAADYAHVQLLMRDLRLPPFEGGLAQVWREAWSEHPVYLSLLLGLFLGLVGLAVKVAVAHRRMGVQSERMQAFIDYAMDAIVQMDDQGLITGRNRRAETMFGWSAREAIGQPLHTLLIPERFRQAHAQGVQRYAHRTAAERAKPSKMVNELVQTHALRRNGEEFPVEVFMSELRHGERLEFSAYIRDITLRHSQMKKLQFAASVFKHAREGITLTDAEGRILDVNDMFTQITGYSAEEVIGRNPRLLQSGRQDAAFYESMWAHIRDHGHWSGEIWNRRKNGEIYPEVLTISAVKDDLGQTSHYVGLFSDITLIKNHQTHLEYLAHYDPLTELPNRVLLHDRLRQALLQADRTGQWVAVAYLDLDGFKEVNDRQGHLAGDHLLATMADRMKNALRAADTLARVGGDEFVAIIAGTEQDDLLATVLRRVLDSVQEPVTHQGVRLQVTASIGVTLYPQDHGDAEHLIRNADQAMYQAKRQGKNQVHLFDIALDTSLKQRHDRLRDIGLALQEHQMVLHYQPKVDLLNGRVVGVEALVRWQHPQQGLLSPGAFLPDIEGHPLSIRLGEWVIAEALRQSRRWAETGLHWPVSVNIAAAQLQSPDFTQRLADLLAGHQGPPLQIEVLETSALDDLFSTRQLMMDAITLGVGFALDDFGTGYSSLSYLRHLPIEHIKIDQSFVRSMLQDANDRAIVSAIVGLARSFDIQVVAEGAETREHCKALLGLGCDIAQGYAIARPMPAAELPGWLWRWQHSGWAQLRLRREQGNRPDSHTDSHSMTHD